MMIGIYNGPYQAHTWFPASVTWTAKASRQMGSASFFIPRTSPVWESGVLNTTGGQLIRIYDGERAWAGIADEPTWDEDGAAIQALEIGQWVSYRPLIRRRVFRAVRAGVIARAAVKD